MASSESDSSPASPSTPQSSHQRSASTSIASDFVDLVSQKTVEFKKDLFSFKSKGTKKERSKKRASHTGDEVGQLYHLGQFSNKLLDDNEQLRSELNSALGRYNKLSKENELLSSKVEMLELSLEAVKSKLEEQGNTMLMEVNHLSESVSQLQKDNDMLTQDRCALLEVFNAQQKKIYLLEEKVTMYKEAADAEFSVKVNQTIEELTSALDQTEVTLELDASKEEAAVSAFSKEEIAQEGFGEEADWSSPPSGMQDFETRPADWEDKWSDDEDADPAAAYKEEEKGQRKVGEDGFMEQPDLANEFGSFLHAASMSSKLNLKVVIKTKEEAEDEQSGEIAALQSKPPLSLSSSAGRRKSRRRGSFAKKRDQVQKDVKDSEPAKDRRGAEESDKAEAPSVEEKTKEPDAKCKAPEEKVKIEDEAKAPATEEKEKIEDETKAPVSKELEKIETEAKAPALEEKKKEGEEPESGEKQLNEAGEKKRSTENSEKKEEEQKAEEAV